MVSFFSIAVLWTEWHRSWASLTGITHLVIYRGMLVLFFLSLNPYVTSLMAEGFTSPVAEVLYGLDTMLVAGANCLLYRAMRVCSASDRARRVFEFRWRVLAMNVAIMAVCLLLALVAWPPFALVGVVIVSATYLMPAMALPHLLRRARIAAGEGD